MLSAHTDMTVQTAALGITLHRHPTHHRMRLKPSAKSCAVALAQTAHVTMEVQGQSMEHVTSVSIAKTAVCGQCLPDASALTMV